MKNSHIEWTDHTFNPWEGCTKVSPGCAHCYAEARNARFGGGEAQNWGKGAPRRRTSGQNWNEPIKWNKAAEEAARDWSVRARIHGIAAGLEPRRPRVFCASLADVGDLEVPIEWFSDLLQLIGQCRQLDWQLLTKRPETFRHRIMHAALYMAGYRDGQTSENPTAPAMERWEWVHDWAVNGKPPDNVWMGTTVENDDVCYSRLKALFEIPARIRFVSCEPLLSEVDIKWVFDIGGYVSCGGEPECSCQGCQDADNWPRTENGDKRVAIDWLICGGESGPGARPMHPDWARSLRDQCAAADVPFFFKQWGEWVSWDFHSWSPNDFPNYVFGQGDEAVSLSRVGKKVAGRILDGVEHNGMPEVRV